MRTVVAPETASGFSGDRTSQRCSSELACRSRSETSRGILKNFSSTTGHRDSGCKDNCWEDLSQGPEMGTRLDQDGPSNRKHPGRTATCSINNTCIFHSPQQTAGKAWPQDRVKVVTCETNRGMCWDVMCLGLGCFRFEVPAIFFARIFASLNP